MAKCLWPYEECPKDCAECAAWYEVADEMDRIYNPLNRKIGGGPMKLIFEVEIQGYDDDEAEVLTAISNALRAVVALSDLSVGTFTTSRLEGMREK